MLDPLVFDEVYNASDESDILYSCYFISSKDILWVSALAGIGLLMDTVQSQHYSSRMTTFTHLHPT